MGEFFQTKAICCFSPALNRSGSTKRRDGKTTEWWLILACDREIGSYLRSLYRMKNHGVRSLNEPLWGTHVSVIRDEKPPNLEAWKRLEGCELEIEYSREVEIHGGYAVAAAHSEAALDYREELGLPREPPFPLHMTIGNLKTSG